MTALLSAYRAATAAALPLVARRQRRRFDALDLADRFDERLGKAVDPRPGIVWVHAVSVGETLSAMPLVEAIAAEEPVLLTTTTPTSADIAVRRLPQGVRHAFAPLDAPGPVGRFLDAHRPKLAIFVESELWPTQIAALGDRNIPLALISARLSAGSARNWSRAPKTAAALFSRLSYVGAQNDETATLLRRHGAPRVEVTGSLKSAAPPLPVDPEEAARLSALIADRPLWVAASTHPGEDEIVAEAHARIREERPEALCILAPRHPERGDDIARRLDNPPRRSAGADPAGPLYLADTMGEMGLWYSLAPVVFLGGSLLPGIGGHNPLEPARFGCAIVTGPHTDNARSDFALLEDAGGAALASDAEDLAMTVLAAWEDASMGAAALGALAPSDLPQRLARTCLDLIGEAR